MSTLSLDRLPAPDAVALREPETEEVHSALANAAALRFPDLRELRGASRVEALVDHIVATAIARGEVEELRLEAQVELLGIRKALAQVPAPVGGTRTKADDHRRSMAPKLALRQDHWRWIADRCTEQINRLGGTDYDAASRLYTLLGG